MLNNLRGLSVEEKVDFLKGVRKGCNQCVVFQSFPATKNAWKARVRKQPELYRAWSILMNNADKVGEYNVVDFAPVIDDYNKNRSAIEEYSQDQFYIMLKEGSSRLNDFLTKLNNQQGCNKATTAINNWYKSYKK